MSRQPTLGRTHAVGIVVPVHNEEQLLHVALDALGHAVANVPTKINVALPSFSIPAMTPARPSLTNGPTDGSRSGSPMTSLLISCGESNVGAARRHGCAALQGPWNRMNPRHLWLATTDADSVVPGLWLTAQIAAHDAGADLWAGRVSVADWSAHAPATARLWNQDMAGREHPFTVPVWV